MKKLICFTLALVLMLTLVACGSRATGDQGEHKYKCEGETNQFFHFNFPSFFVFGVLTSTRGNEGSNRF